jgi:enoyl-CoA hydratase/carnithine racemase
MPGQLKVDEPAEGVRRLTISNPAKRNALDHPILDAIAAEVTRAPADGVRALILTGENRMFSSGYDIGDIPPDLLAQEAEKLVAHPFTGALQALDACDLPIVAALTGHTIGGGLELALACDLRVAADDIKLGMPPAKLGLVYSHTGLRRFIDAIGVPRTNELFLLGTYIDAPRALDWGLVNATAPAHDVGDSAQALAVTLVANAPLSIHGNKRIIRALLRAEGELDADVVAELVAVREACFVSDDFREGVAAFAEKRAPRWQGR